MTGETAKAIIKAIYEEQLKDKFLLSIRDEMMTKVDDAFKVAFELLDREPCEDAVSRQAVLNTLDFTDKFLDETRTVESYKTLLEECYKNLPSVTPIHKDRTVQDFVDKCRECGKQRWIPCSERLPEEEGDYLLWGKVCEDEDEYPFIGSYDSGCEQFGIWQEQFDATTLGCLGSEFFEYASVIAWMPLPEKYNAESEEEEKE